MGLADQFQEIVDSLPRWTDLELDLRVRDERRYVEAALYLVICNADAVPADWHWRLLVAHRFGHAASAPTVHGSLVLLDNAGIAGEMAVREVRSGRTEVTPMWGRPESVREQFRTSSSAAARTQIPWPASSRWSPTSCSGRASSRCSRPPATRSPAMGRRGRRRAHPEAEFEMVLVVSDHDPTPWTA